MEWPTARLSELCDVTIGATPSRSRPEYWAGEYPWVTVGELNGGVLTNTKERITDLGVANSSSKLVRAGTLLFSFKLSIGKMAFAGVDLYTNEAIAALPIRDTRVLSARYLYYSLLSGDTLAPVNVAAKGRLLNKAALQNFRIPLPPLSEQYRIVEILDQANRLRRLRTEADAKADRLLSALFVKMFGDPATNSKGWPKHSLDELATVTTGNTPPRKRPEYYGNFIEWIKSDNLNTASHYVTPATERLSELGAKIARTVPSGSTLVTCIAGSLSAIGNAALADRRVAFNQQINAATPKEGIDSYFLYGHFVVGKRLVQEASTGGMKGLVSKSRFCRIAFLMPPFDLQEQFGHHCRKLCKQNQARLSQDFQFDSLFATLLHRAFSAELTASWREAHMKELVQEMEQQAKLPS